MGNSEKNIESSGDRVVNCPLDAFVSQLKNMAQGLDYGRLVVEFGVRAGKIHEAHVIDRHMKLSPIKHEYTTE